MGLATPGVEIAIPLTPRLCLVMLAADTVEIIRARAHQYTGVPKAPAEAADPRIMCAAFNTGSAVELHPENVTHLNARQIGFPSRDVYSVDGRFELAPDDPGRPRVSERVTYRSGLIIQIIAPIQVASRVGPARPSPARTPKPTSLLKLAVEPP